MAGGRWSGRRRAGRPGPAALLTAALALAGMGLAEAGDRDAFRASGAVVVDALDQPLGPIVAAGATASRVLLRVGDQAAIVLVERNRFLPEMGVSVEYESGDCTGPAWIEAFFPDQPSLAARTALGAGNVLLAASGPPEDRQIRSAWNALLDPPGCSGPFGPFTATVFPAAPLVDLNAFVPPFRPVVRGRATTGFSGRDAFGPATVVDAAGAPIGSLLGMAGSDSVGALVEISGRITILEVTGDRFYSSGVVAYENAGCTGAVHVLGPSAAGLTPLFDQVGVGPDSTLFGATGPFAPILLGSRWDNNTPTPGCLNGSFTHDAAPAVPIGDLGVFTAPFGAR